ncbi:MAG: hypothetical protein HOF02_07695 [Gammaproteobacteria bacterium]|jgi:hypothetical protein|nr:hypothetical protein [Gammaproteobacteria bacterium]
MNSIKNLITDFTELAVGIIALGVVAGVVFGDVPFVGGILNNFIETVYAIGNSGAAAITLAIIVYVYSKNTN